MNLNLLKEKALDPVTWFTLLLVGVGFLQWRTLEKTDETLRVQQRAWINIVGSLLAQPLEIDQPIRMQLFISNSGREPARFVRVAIQNDIIESYDPKNTDMRDIEVPEKRSCSQNGTEGLVVPPSSGLANVAIAEDSAHGITRYLIEKKILEKTKYYVVQGCIHYLSLDKDRHSSFCFILQPQDNKPAAIPVAQAVPPAALAVVGGDGAKANITFSTVQIPGAIPLPTHLFVTCRSGFEVD